MTEVTALELQRKMNALGSRLKEDGDLGPKSRLEIAGYLREVARNREADRADTIPVPSSVVIDLSDSQPPTLKEGSGSHVVTLTLGQHALAWCIQEAERWDNTRIPDAEVAEYFRTCTRINTAGLGPWMHDEQLAGKDYPFCAAFQGFAEESSRGVPASMLPPHRAGVLELMRDAQAGRRPNERWAPLSEFYDEKANRFIKAPPPGSLVIYGNRADETRGHAERLIEATAEGIRSVGGNENDRRIVMDLKPIAWRNLERADGTQRLYLLGFIVPLEVQA